MGKAKTIGKKIVAGTTTASLGLVGALGGHYWFRGGEAGEAGAVVDMHEDSAMMLYDVYGKAAFLNYFGVRPEAPLSMKVSITTTDTMPDKLQNWMGQATQLRQEHVSRRIETQDFRAITPESAEVIRGFFSEFEKWTGIHVEVVENDPSAQIILGGYETHDDFIGFASFPQEMPGVGMLLNSQGYLMLDVHYMEKKIAEGNTEAAAALVSHEFGHNLGLLHPFDGLVSTAESEKQQNGVSRMSYNNHTFPPIASTTIDSGYGPLDIFHIRQALKEQGYPVPAINPEDDIYVLEALAEEAKDNSRAKTGRLTQVPALSLLDTGGQNMLRATDGDDLLVTEAGYCGLLNRQEQNISLLKDGQPFCLVEGAFAVVKSGDGNDLILTARGSEQRVYLASGQKEVALLDQEIGEKSVYTLDDSAPENVLEAVGEALGITENSTTLTLHQSLFDNSVVKARVEGKDVVLEFSAFSGRELGSITLKEQAKDQHSEGIDTFRVIDNAGGELLSFDVADLHTAAEWQAQVLAPIEEKAKEEGQNWARAEIARARQALAGSAGDWTAGTEAVEESTSYGETHEHSHGESVNKITDNPDNGPVKYAQDDSFEGYLRRRRDRDAAQGGKGARL